MFFYLKNRKKEKIKKVLYFRRNVICLHRQTNIIFLMKDFTIKKGVLVDYNGKGGDVVIPDSVTEIGNWAFDGCTGLTSIVIPNSVTKIGNWAFDGCTGLTSIVIPNSVTKIGEGAFYGCTSLTSIVVAKGNDKYDSRDNCNAIIETATNTLVNGCMNTVIPDSVTKIGGSAFRGCSNLTSINIPDSVTEIGDWAFSGCASLASIVVAKGNGKYDSRNDCNAIIETATNTLVTGCMNTLIPDSVTEIGEYAFFGCSNLTSINIPDSVTEIGYRAFSDCHSLTSISIPDSVTGIGWSAFSGCSNLTSINIPDSVTEIGGWVFYGCCSLTSINIPDSVTEIGNYAFGGTNIKHNPKGSIAYKNFNPDMTCRGFQYKEGETYTCNEASLCECGFHACLNPLDCFNYYYGKDVISHEVILEDRSDEVNVDDSKVCGRKITIGRRLTLHEMGEIFNELNK